MGVARTEERRRGRRRVVRVRVAKCIFFFLSEVALNGLVVCVWCVVCGVFVCGEFEVWLFVYLEIL